MPKIDPNKYSKIGLYFANLQVGLSQFINTLIGGDPDETLSSRVGKMKRGITNSKNPWLKPIQWGNQIFVIFWKQKDHWNSAIEDDKGDRALWKFKGEEYKDIDIKNDK
jgi:hypothetical protein